MLETIKETFSNKERTKLIEELWLNLDKEEKSKYSEGFHEYRFIQECIYEYYNTSFEHAIDALLIVFGIFSGITVFLTTFYHNEHADMISELIKFLFFSALIAVGILLLSTLFVCSNNKNEKKYKEHYYHIIEIIHKDFGDKYDFFINPEYEYQKKNNNYTKSYLVVVKEIDDSPKDNK